MVGTATVDGSVKTRGDRVTYVLREPEQHHRFGISSLALGKEELYTAGRDGTVRAWKLPPAELLSEQPPPYTQSYATSLTFPAEPPPVDSSVPLSPKCIKTFDEHVDWVNDVLYLKNERLISCSSDTTVKVWNVKNPSESLRTLKSHTDYVKALAPVPNGVASGSLDGRVIVWDLVTGDAKREFGVGADDSQAPNGSVYCMSGTGSGDILVSGSTDKTISVWDLRTSERAVHLRGHSDAVRCLILNHDANYMLSGATDATIKLWDLRIERCIRSFDSLAGSVWAITANERFDSFISGGRDGSVWHTDMNGDVASVIVPVADPDPRSNMVLDVALSSCSSGVWVSTTGSSVRLWSLPSEIRSQMGSTLGPTVGLSNGLGMRNSSADGKSMTVQSKSTTSPLYVIPGLPGIIAQHVMNNRRHVLTCDTRGEYKIWDITQGKLLKSLGVLEYAKFEDVLKEHDSEVAVSSWFHVDIRLGSLLVRLEKSTVANAEIYAVDAGLDASSEEAKVNIGEHVVLGLFRGWLEKYKELEASGEKVDSCVSEAEVPKNLVNRAAELPQYKFSDHIPVVITKVSSPVPILRRTTGGFDGTEEPELPQWVVDLVRDGKGQSRELVKISFTLEPVEGGDLPQLPNMTLNAAKVLRVRKVMSYLAKELKDPGADFGFELNQFEILCNGKVLPSNMSLAAVRQFRWRSPDDLKLYYRLKAPGL